MKKLSEKELEYVAGGVLQVYNIEDDSTRPNGDQWPHKCHDCGHKWLANTWEYVCPICGSNDVGHGRQGDSI